MPYVRPFCACVRAVKSLVRLHACLSFFEHWLIKETINTPILCMCESSEGSGKTANLLSLVWALTERIAIYTPILYMCESSRGSRKTAHTLRLVWAFTEGICHMYAHFAHLREQWTLWLDCMHTKSRLSIDWQNIPYLRPFCACTRAVEALARLHTRLGSSEH